MVGEGLYISLVLRRSRCFIELCVGSSCDEYRKFDLIFNEERMNIYVCVICLMDVFVCVVIRF